MRLNKEKIKNENIEKNKMRIVWYEDDDTSISVSCGYESWNLDLREKKMAKKNRQKRYIEKGMNITLHDEQSKKKGKKHIRKPKMPARIKKDQTHKKNR